LEKGIRVSEKEVLMIIFRSIELSSLLIIAFGLYRNSSSERSSFHNRVFESHRARFSSVFCRICGRFPLSGIVMTAHHLDPLCGKGEKKKKNATKKGLVVCNDCHDRVHHNPVLVQRLAEMACANPNQRKYRI
jgi:hypothetical protein